MKKRRHPVVVLPTGTDPPWKQVEQVAAEVIEWLFDCWGTFTKSGLNEATLNIAVTLAVIFFISYQVHSLFLQNSKGAKEEEKSKKELVDRAVGEGLDASSLHNDIVNNAPIAYRAVRLKEDESMKRSQIFYETLKSRRSVRNFSSEPVPMKLLSNLIKAAGTAPSVNNAQPWRFSVIGDDRIKFTIQALLEDAEKMHLADRAGAEWVVGVETMSVNWKRGYISDAPFLIVVSHEVYYTSKSGEQKLSRYHELSTSIAVGFLLTAIQTAGLVTVTTSPLNVGARIAKLLKLPEGHNVLLLLPVGYPSDDASVPDIKRKPIEDLITLY